MQCELISAHIEQVGMLSNPGPSAGAADEQQAENCEVHPSSLQTCYLCCDPIMGLFGEKVAGAVTVIIIWRESSRHC